jgi:dynein heavy chain, axonemal
MRNWLQ